LYKEKDEEKKIIFDYVIDKKKEDICFRNKLKKDYQLKISVAKMVNIKNICYFLFL
jgi:hypothetical protein